MLFSPKGSFEPNAIAAWPTFLCYIIAAGVICFAASIPIWRQRLAVISTGFALAGSATLWATLPQIADGTAVPVAVLAALGLADSLYWNGYRLHGRQLTVLPAISIGFLWATSALGLSWVLNTSVVSASTINRDSFTALVTLLLLGWFYHIATAWVIVGDGTAALGEANWRVRTQNGPRFNLLHDSLFIAPCMSLGATPLIWQALGRPGGIETLMSLTGATILGVGIVIKFGVLNGFAHMREPPIGQQAPHNIGLRMIAQWSILGLLLAAGWIGPFLAEASQFLSETFR
ncbi:hypothetical protein [Micropruina sp.]|uniref:hypothetical protein n=1 Tax=Micropruina sp. TaxID=2737536 RepID=UPI0039E4A306